MIYFTADTHFSHKAVLQFENRPFVDIGEMNTIIINNWNSMINREDDIYILGDFSFANNATTLSILNQLNGNKYLIKGNHDNMSAYVKEQFIWVKDYYKLKLNNKYKFILCHYPIFAWDGKGKENVVHLHGHTHTNSREDVFLDNKINVGVDLWNFKPVSFNDIINKIEKRA